VTNLERTIQQSPPVTFIADKCKRIIFPGFYGIPLYDAFNFFIRQLRKSGLNGRAKSISFDFAMAIPAVQKKLANSFSGIFACYFFNDCCNGRFLLLG